MGASEIKVDASRMLRELDERLAFCGNVDLREVTISDLQKAMETGQVTALDLVRCYSKRIKFMDPYLNAIIQRNPDAEMIAKELDENRKNGILYGPLHGIPIVIKDTIATNDKMETSGGSLSLVGIRPKEDAEVVKRLRNAGAVILGKTNMTELGCFKCAKKPNGWSSRGNQTRSPYVLSKDPDGSSSGSGVAISANLATIALGTETDGSIIDPSSRGSLVGLKPSIHKVPTSGLIRFSFSQDVIGPMTRTVADAAILFDVISNSKIFRNFGNNTLEKNGSISVGVLRSPNWEQPEVAEQLKMLEEVLIVLRSFGVTVKDPVEAAPGTISTVTRNSENIVLNHEFKHCFNDYLKNDVKANLNADGFSIQSLDDVLEYNKQYPNGEEYDQALLIESVSTKGIMDTTYIAERNKNEAGAKLYTNYIFEKYDLDGIIIPNLNSSLIPCVAGYPIITVPVGTTMDGLPFGISIYGKINAEQKLLHLAFLIENSIKGRVRPSFLQ